MDVFATPLPALADAWALILQPVVLGYLVLGVVMGLAVGAFPGLGGIAGLSLLLPFMFGMEPVLGLALMAGMVAVVPTSDTFSSVLMEIPGSSASQATVLDGFPLARKGQAARALSATFTASLFGGLVGALFLTLFIVVARPLVLAFGLPEMLMISILGLSMVAVLAGRVALKGLAAAGLGMLIGTIEVGPGMLHDNLEITCAIVWLLALANVAGTLLCIAVSGGIARLTTIRFTYLAPFLFMLIAFAAFQSGQNFEDILALFAIGLIGIFLPRFDWSRPAFLIGFVLSAPVEKFSNQAFQIASFRFRKSFEDGMDYLFSPIVIVLLIVMVLSVVPGLRQAKSIMAEDDVPSGSERAPNLFLLVILAYVVAALLNANGIPDHNMTDKIVPLVIGGIALSALLILLVQMILRSEGDAIFTDKEMAGEDADAPYGLWGTLAWFGRLIAATYVLGFILALAGVLMTFLRVRGQASWPRTVILTASGIALMCAMGGALNRDFPPGLLQDAVDLPWPLK